MESRARFHVENLHSQIADDLIRRIASGNLAAGSALPPDAELASEYGVAPNTLRRALDHVAELQLIDRRKGRVATVGDVVAARRTSTLISTMDLQGNRVLGDFEQRNARIEQAPQTASVALRQKVPKPVLRFERLRSHNGRCFMVEDVYLPIRYGDLEGDQDHLDKLVREIWWQREVAQAKRERLWLEDANEADVRLLGVSAGRSVLCVERVLFGARNLPLEYRVGRCNFGPDLVYVSY